MVQKLRKNKSSAGIYVGPRYNPTKFNRSNYTYTKLGGWNRFIKNHIFLVSVVYDLPGPHKRNEPVNCVFDSSHWPERINMLRFAAPYLAEINPTAICLPADFIGYPGWDNSSIPDKKVPDNSVIKKIRSSKTCKDLISAWQASSISLFFGYGFVDEEGSPEENQLICVVNRDEEVSIIRKNVDKTIYDWPRSTKIQNRKYSIAVCFDQEKVDWDRTHRNNIMVNPRHMSSIGIKKDEETFIGTAKRTGTTRPGRLPAVMNRRIDKFGFTHIFCPVFRFKIRTETNWDPTLIGFTWSAKKSVTPHSHYKPQASLLVEKADGSERAYFNIFKV